MTSIRHHLKAGAIHLAASSLIALLSLVIIFFAWYPGALAEMQGVSQLVLILIGVDVVIGPLITTIIYRPGKKGLTFDLVVIAALQTVALLYGLKAIEGGRPAYVVFNVDRFDVVTVDEINAVSLAKVRPGLEVSWFGPRWVLANLPKDPKVREQLMLSAISGGADLPQMPEFFEAWSPESPAVRDSMHDLSELILLNDIKPDDWRRKLRQWKGSESSLAYIPIRANRQDGALIVDRGTLKPVQVTALTPNFKKAASHH